MQLHFQLQVFNDSFTAPPDVPAQLFSKHRDGCYPTIHFLRTDLEENFFTNIGNQETSESPKQKLALQPPTFFLQETKNISNAYSNYTIKVNSMQKLFSAFDIY